MSRTLPFLSQNYRSRFSALNTHILFMSKGHVLVPPCLLHENKQNTPCSVTDWFQKQNRSLGRPADLSCDVYDTGKMVSHQEDNICFPSTSFSLRRADLRANTTTQTNQSNSSPARARTVDFKEILAVTQSSQSRLPSNVTQHLTFRDIIVCVS